MPERPEVNGKVTHRSLQRSLGHTHHVVAGHNFLRAVVRHGQAAAAGVEERQRPLHHRGEGVAAYVQRSLKAGTAGGVVHTGQFRARCVRHGMHQNIQRAKALPGACKQRVKLCITGHIALFHKVTAHLGRQRQHAALQDLARITKGQPRALAVQCLSHAPRNRVVIGNPKY